MAGYRIKGGGGTVGGGDSDGTANLGNEDEAFALQSINTLLESLGTESHASLDSIIENLTVDVGADAQAMAQSDIGSGSSALGSEAESMGQSEIGSGAALLGDESDAFLANSSITARDQSTTQTRVDITPAGGDATWANPTNAASENATSATITRTGQLLATTAFSDELRLETFTPASTPSGWTLATANIRVVHSWVIANPLLDLLSTATFTIVARYTDATEDTLFTLTQGSADQGTLLATTLDISNRIITGGKTLERIMCRAVTTIALAQTGTTKTWNVDVGLLEYIYTRTGIT